MKIINHQHAASAVAEYTLNTKRSLVFKCDIALTHPSHLPPTVDFALTIIQLPLELSVEKIPLAAERPSVF